MLSDIQKSAARLMGERLLTPEQTAAELSLPLETVQSYKSDPEFLEAVDSSLVAGAEAEAEALFGGKPEPEDADSVDAGAADEASRLFGFSAGRG